MLYDILMFVLVLAVIFIVAVAIVIGFGILFAATVKYGFKAATGAIEKFFGPGCEVRCEGHTVMVRQLVPLLELATAKGEFEHSFIWKRAKAKFFGLPVPFTGREALCRHVYVAKAGFNLKMRECSFEFIPERRYGFLPSLFSKVKYLAVVTIPEPQILSIETISLNIEDRSGAVDFWNKLDRNAINSEMFALARQHVEKAGCGLFEASKSKLESGLRSVLPACVDKIEFKWVAAEQGAGAADMETI